MEHFVKYFKENCTSLYALINRLLREIKMILKLLESSS